MREESCIHTKSEYFLKRDLLYAENPIDVVKELEKYKHAYEWKTVEYEAFEPSENAIISLKIDGELNALYFREGKASFYSRTGRERTGLPVTREVEEILSDRGIESALFFGELYAVDAEEKPVPYPKALSLLRTLKPEEELERIRFIVFDVHSINGRKVEGDYWERFLTIRDIFEEGKFVRPAATVIGSRKEMEKFWEKVKKGLAEGIVVREDSLYKIKPKLTLDLAVIGVEVSKTHPDLMGALVLAFLDRDGVFRYAGKVGTGFSDTDRREWLEFAKENQVRREGRVIYVKPVRVVEIETTHGVNVREAPAYYGEDLEKVEDRVSAVARVPVFVRIREDKKVSPADLRLEQVPVFTKSDVVLNRGVVSCVGGHLFVRSDLLKEAKLDVPADVIHIVSFTPGFYPSFAVHSPGEEGEGWGWVEPGGYHWIGTLYPPNSFMIFENIPDRMFMPVLVRCPKHGLVLRKTERGYECPKGDIFSDEEISRMLWPRTIWEISEPYRPLPAFAFESDPGLFLRVRPYQYARAPLEVIAKLKPGTEKEVVIESPHGRLTKKDIYEYYKAVYPEMKKYILGKELMVFIKTDDVVIRRHPPGGDSIIVEDETDFDELNTGRTVEFHITVGSKTKLAWVDVDPGKDFPFTEVKKITVALRNRLRKFGKVFVKFSGRRGFHILIELPEERDVDELRRSLDKELQEYIKEANLKNVTTKEKKSERECRLDVSTLHELGTIKAPYSLDARTGLVSVPVENIESFELKQALPSTVSKSAQLRLRLRRLCPWWYRRPRRIFQDELMRVWERHPWLGREPLFVQIGGGGFWFREWPEDSSLVYPETRAPATIDTLVTPTRTPWLTQPSPAIIVASVDKSSQRERLLSVEEVALRYDPEKKTWTAIVKIRGREVIVPIEIRSRGEVEITKGGEEELRKAGVTTDSLGGVKSVIEQRTIQYYNAFEKLKDFAGKGPQWVSSLDRVLKDAGGEPHLIRNVFFETLFGVPTVERAGVVVTIGDLTVYFIKDGYHVIVSPDLASYLTEYYRRVAHVERISTTVFRDTAALEVSLDLVGRVTFYVYKPKEAKEIRIETAGGETIDEFARRRKLPEELVNGVKSLLVEFHKLYLESLDERTESYKELEARLESALNAMTVYEVAKRVRSFKPFREVAMELQPILGEVALVLVNYIRAYPGLTVDLKDFVREVGGKLVAYKDGVGYPIEEFYAVKDMYENYVMFRLVLGKEKPKVAEIYRTIRDLLGPGGETAFNNLKTWSEREEVKAFMEKENLSLGALLEKYGFDPKTLVTVYNLLPSELREFFAGEKLRVFKVEEIFPVLQRRLGDVLGNAERYKKELILAGVSFGDVQEYMKNRNIPGYEEFRVLVTLPSLLARPSTETGGELKSSLVEYMRKRDLKTSGEPIPKSLKKEPSKGFGIIAVQEHRAYRAGLHYDLRIEDEGVLKSWVVRQYPQFVSGEKDRVFAIQVEDHPLEYVTEMPKEFEIKSGYGAGRVALFDKGSYKTLKKEPNKWVFEVNMKNAKETWYLYNIEKDKWLLGRKK